MNQDLDIPPGAPDSRRDRMRSLRRLSRSERRKAMFLRSTSVLPAMCTLLNGLCGLGAIHLATRDAPGAARMSLIADGCWLIFLAMVFDMLDGRLARWARKTSDFGAQLDSLCDAVSFGVAPGILMLRTVMVALPSSPAMLERAIWCVAAIFMSCAILRLARFNVENEPDESAHMSFRGLPSPGAAAVVASMVLLVAWMKDTTREVSWLDPLGKWTPGDAIITAACVILPIVTLTAALLMVSRFRYPHVVNQYIRGKKPFSYLVKIMVIVMVGLAIGFFPTVAIITLAYALSGPIGAIFRKVKKPPAAAPPTPQ